MRTCMLLLVGLALCWAISRPADAQQADTVVFLEERPLEVGEYRGQAVLTVAPSAIKLGEKFSIDIRFINRGVTAHFFNPFFKPLILPHPAQLAIFDGEKRYLGDLLAWPGGSVSVTTSREWTYIPTDAYVGVVLQSVPAGYLPPYGFKKLPAGEYYLQLIYYRYFIARNPASTTDEQAAITDFYKTLDRRELFRSNVVTVRFVE